MSHEIRTEQAAFLLAIGMAAGLCVVFMGLWWHAGRPGEPIVLEDTINPNTAPVASLLRLPGVGPQRAQAIVAYREGAGTQRGRPAFRDLNDVGAVPGLGPVTTKAMAPYLRFDDQ